MTWARAFALSVLAAAAVSVAFVATGEGLFLVSAALFAASAIFCAGAAIAGNRNG